MDEAELRLPTLDEPLGHEPHVLRPKGAGGRRAAGDQRSVAASGRQVGGASRQELVAKRIRHLTSEAFLEPNEVLGALFCGRLAWRKGLGTASEAFPLQLNGF